MCSIPQKELEFHENLHSTQTQMFHEACGRQPVLQTYSEFSIFLWKHINVFGGLLYYWDIPNQNKNQTRDKYFWKSRTWLIAY